MTAGARPDQRTDDEERSARLVRWTGRVLAALLALLGVATVLSTAVTPRDLLELLHVGLVGGLAVTLFIYRGALMQVAHRQRDEEQSLTRILQGLSRSTSPDAVVSVIVEELRQVSGADHVAVVRLSEDQHHLEATLVSAGTAVPVSRTRLPVGTLEGPGDRAALEQIAIHLRSAYGLRHILAEPLVADERLVGAVLLSRRRDGIWPAQTRGLLSWAASEVSAALARAYAYRAAETRASLDALTGLPNRRYFEELTELLKTGRRARDRLGILMIDIDHFKRLNDRYGHLTGDGVLRTVARAIAGSVRAEDTPARYGGEEFVVVLPHISPERAGEVGERIRSAVAGLPPAGLGTNEPVSVSVGVAVSDSDTPSVAALVERADRALYAAKRAGRDRVLVA